MSQARRRGQSLFSLQTFFFLAQSIVGPSVSERGTNGRRRRAMQGLRLYALAAEEQRSAEQSGEETRKHCRCCTKLPLPNQRARPALPAVATTLALLLLLRRGSARHCPRWCAALIGGWRGWVGGAHPRCASGPRCSCGSTMPLLPACPWHAATSSVARCVAVRAASRWARSSG